LSRLFVSADRRLAIWWRLLVAIVLWFIMLIVTEELITALLGPIAGAITVIGGSVGLAMLLRRRIDHRSMAGLGLDRRGAVPSLIAGFAFGTVAMVGILGWATATHAIRLEHWNARGLHPGYAGALLLGHLAFFLGVGFTEELLFRGYILQNLGESMPRWGALLLSSVLFGLFHGLQATPLDLVEIALGGLMLGLMRLATGTLWLAIGFHAAWDFVEDGVAGTRMLPAHGPMPEQTAGGWIVPLVISVALVVLLARRGRGFDWRARMSTDGPPVPVAA
jgi:membrane protease YdiL (CAAX protease family)